MATQTEVERYLENWQNEVDSAAEYRAMAAGESDPRIAKVYTNLAKMEETHIAFWEERLRAAAARVPARRPSWRSRVLALIARRVGPDAVLSTIAAKEAVDQHVYVNQPETQGTRMSAQERWHARGLGQLVHTQPRGLSGSFLGRIEGRHRAVGGNALRAAVLGANDGLCSNLSLVMGVAGAATNGHAILLTGVAGLLAGACSMALGEWVSVTSARELAEREIRIESSELAEDPKGEGQELQLIYEAKGMSSGEAQRVVTQLMSDQAATLDALTREEARHRSERAGRLCSRSRYRVLYAVRTGRGCTDHSIHPGHGQRSDRGEPRSGRARAVRNRRRDHHLHGSTGLAVGWPDAPAGPGRGWCDVRGRPPDRRCSHLKRWSE